MKRKFWTKEEIDYLTENYADKKNQDLSLILDRTISSITGKSSPLGLKKSKAFWKRVGGIYAAQCKHTQFKKGNISFNKGKKQVDYMSKEKIEKVKKTQFKKGNRPHNAKGPDYESITKQSKGYCYKLKKDANGVLVYHHRLLWEKHNGKIPKDMIIIFKNKDTLDCRIDNLMAITRSEHLERNYLQYPNEIKRGIKLKNKLEKQLKN